jgi:hypothetical protein
VAGNRLVATPHIFGFADCLDQSTVVPLCLGEVEIIGRINLEKAPWRADFLLLEYWLILYLADFLRFFRLLAFFCVSENAILLGIGILA